MQSQTQLVRRRLLSGGAWALGGRTAGGVIALAINALLARLLSPQDFGAFVLVVTVVLLRTQLGALGLNRSVVRFVAEGMSLNRSSRVRQTIKLTLLIGSAGAFGVATAYFFFLGSFLAENIFHSPAMAAVSGLIAGWIVVLIFQLLFSETFRGFHDVRLATIFGGSVAGLGLMKGGLLATSLLVLLLLRGSVELATVVSLAVAAGATTVLLSGWMLGRKAASLPKGHESGQVRLGEMLGVSWPPLVTSLTIFVLFQADLWIVGIFGSQEEVALYGAASRMVLMISVPLTIVNAVVPPLISELYAQGRIGELERTLRTTAVVAGIPAFLVLMSFVVAGAPIMQLIFGDYYREAAVLLMLLSLGRLVYVWTGSSGEALMMTGHQTTMMAVIVSVGVLTVAAEIWAVQHFGAMGVAGAAAVGFVLQNIFMLLVVRKKVGVWAHAGLSELLSMARSGQ